MSIPARGEALAYQDKSKYVLPPVPECFPLNTASYCHNPTRFLRVSQHPHPTPMNLPLSHFLYFCRLSKRPNMTQWKYACAKSGHVDEASATNLSTEGAPTDSLGTTTPALVAGPQDESPLATFESELLKQQLQVRPLPDMGNTSATCLIFWCMWQRNITCFDNLDRTLCHLT
jgi:hypothetical protein